MAAPPSASASTSPPTATTTAKKPQALSWSHQETVQLIQAYQERWYSLKRRQLKSSQWEEVAVTVAARCGYDHSHPSKSGIQCRHKMEKLRQRYRAEKYRLPLSSSLWLYFQLMDSLERGPFPISARPLLALPSTHHQQHEEEKEEEEEEDDHADEVENYSRSRRIDCVLSRPAVVDGFAGDQQLSSRGGGGRDGNWGWGPAAKKRRETEDYEVEVEVMGLEGQRRLRRSELVLKLAGEIRAFAQRLVGMENMKMEIIRETERCRMEMESKRMDMILQSQHKIVDSIAKAFESSNHFKMAQQEM